ncbi:MAG: transcription elongation factor Spt5 [Candidatus Pacearchaeota archaeon]
MIFILKVTTNKEERAMEMIHERAITKHLQVFSIARPHGLKGYLILEAANRDSIEEAAFNLPYVKGIIGKTVTYEEIKNMIQPEVKDVNIEVGDIVEMIADHFKNEKGKVTRVDKKKGEVVVSLLGAAVPIPVTVKIDNVRVIRRESQQPEEENASY